MTPGKRWKMLAKEQIKMTPTGEETKLTKEDEIKGLQRLMKCMKHFEDLPDEELKKIYDEELKKIEEKYL